MKSSKRKTRSDKFPLTRHPTGQYCKKIHGKMYYFGSDKQEAVQRYIDQVGLIVIKGTQNRGGFVIEPFKISTIALQPNTPIMVDIISSSVRFALLTYNYKAFFRGYRLDYGYTEEYFITTVGTFVRRGF